MSFKPHVFQDNIAGRVAEATAETLAQACAGYDTLTTPLQRARCIKGIMDVLDQAVDAPTRQAIMQACGRQCIGASVLDEVRKLAQTASDLDDLLARLNQVHIGGGHLRREGDVIHVSYDRCYCGSVNQTREPFSPTYCHCSRGWLDQLFEVILGHPVEVELLGSIIQGDTSCRFLIHTQTNKSHD